MTPTTPVSDDELDKILIDLYLGRSFRVETTDYANHKQTENPAIIQAKAALNQLMYTEFMSLIGEDETPEIPVNDYHWRFRNEYRGLLRTAAAERFGQ